MQQQRGRKLSKANQRRKEAGQRTIGRGAKRDSRQTVNRNQQRQSQSRQNRSTSNRSTSNRSNRSNRQNPSGGRARSINLGTGDNLYLSRVKPATAEFFGLQEAQIPDDFRGRGSKNAGSFQVVMDDGKQYSFPQHPEIKLADVRRFVRSLNPRPSGFISREGVYHSVGA